MRLYMISESTQLNEKLGNLAALKLGNLINLLKQDGRYGVKSTFYKNAYTGPGNTSQIVDAGVLKNGIAGLRKAYRDYGKSTADQRGAPFISAFAIYLNGDAVVFGMYTADTLAGKSRTGQFAYDLSKYEDAIDAQNEKENEGNPSYRQTRKMTPTSAYDREDRDWNSSDRSAKIITKFIGSDTSTGELSEFLDKLGQIAELLGATITLKLVTNDRDGVNRGTARRQLQPVEVRDAGEDLKNRLVKYKNSKRPTAENIHQFLSLVMSKAASVINLDGRAWKSTPNQGGSHSQIDPAKLMSGQPFSISYRTAEPQGYDSLEISYRYNTSDNTIKPWQASWYDVNHKKVEIVMDPGYWVQSTLKVNNLEKPTVIKQMLTMIKNSPSELTYKKIAKSISALKQIGEDWSEFAIIQRSIDIERAKEKK